MAKEYDIADKINRDTAELLRDSDDAILAFGDREIFRLEPRENGDSDDE